MTLSILSQQMTMGAASYYDEDWHLLIETHLPLLIADTSNTSLPVTDIDAYRFEGDLFGLLCLYKVEPQYHFIVMRMNGLRSPSEYRRQKTVFLLPDKQRIEAFRKTYMTISAKTN